MPSSSFGSQTACLTACLAATLAARGSKGIRPQTETHPTTSPEGHRGVREMKNVSNLKRYVAGTILTLSVAVTVRCSLTGTVCSPSVLSGSVSWILRRSTVMSVRRERVRDVGRRDRAEERLVFAHAPANRHVETLDRGGQRGRHLDLGRFAAPRPSRARARSASCSRWSRPAPVSAGTGSCARSRWRPSRCRRGCRRVRRVL